MAVPSAAIMTILAQTTSYLSERYAKLGRIYTSEESALLQKTFAVVKVEDERVNAAALSGDLSATKVACRALIAAYRQQWKW